MIPLYAMQDVGAGSRLILLARYFFNCTCLEGQPHALWELFFTFCFSFFSAVGVVVAITSTVGARKSEAKKKKKEKK